MSAGAVTLIAHFKLLEVACTRCDRQGRLSIARLIRDYGRHAGLPALRRVVAKGGPLIAAGAFHEQCGVHYPSLVSN